MCERARLRPALCQHVPRRERGMACVRARACVRACGPSLALGSGQDPGHPVYRLRLAVALPTRCRVTVECEHAVVVIARKALRDRRKLKRRHPRPLGPGCTSASVCVFACVCAAGCAPQGVRPACVVVGTRLCRCRPNPIAKQKFCFAIISKQKIPSHNRIRSYETRHSRSQRKMPVQTRCERARVCWRTLFSAVCRTQRNTSTGCASCAGRRAQGPDNSRETVRASR